VYRPVGWNAGGFGDNTGKSASGSPTMLRTIRNLSGRSVIFGRIFSATGLYFFLVGAYCANADITLEDELVDRVAFDRFAFRGSENK
jgi:hypothetical protein